VEDSECERKPASYSELGNVFSERSNSVFWDKIWTIINNFNAAMQIKKNLVCATKPLEGLKSTLGALRHIFSVSEYLSFARGLSTNTLTADKATEVFKDRNILMEKCNFG
jgi:hypothetical protein